jgi:hypothetical protein
VLEWLFPGLAALVTSRSLWDPGHGLAPHPVTRPTARRRIWGHHVNRAGGDPAIGVRAVDATRAPRLPSTVRPRGAASGAPPRTLADYRVTDPTSAVDRRDLAP